MGAGRTAAVANVFRADVAIIRTGCVVRFEAVRWTGRTCPCTALGYITDPGCGAALHRGGLEAVSWAVVTHPITALGEVTGSDCRPALGRALGIGWAGCTCSCTSLGHITDPG